MKKVSVLPSLILIIFVLALPVRAETLTAVINLSSVSEVPPVTGLDASGVIFFRAEVNRNSSGTITSGSVQFLTSFNFPGSVTVTMIHLHEGAITANGPVRVDSALTTQTFASGKGQLVPGASIPLDVLQRLIANPAGFYLDLHTSDNPSGALRGQLTRIVESLVGGANLEFSTAPIGQGQATVTIYPTRNSSRQITGGTIEIYVT